MDEAGETNNCGTACRTNSEDSDNIYPESLDLASQPVTFDASCDLTVYLPCTIFKIIMGF